MTLGNRRLSLLLLAVLGTLPESSNAGDIHAGISVGAGVGAFVAEDEDFYMGIRTDLYPEIGLYMDVSAIQIGLTGALIYRKKEQSYWSSWGYGGYYESKILLIPTQLEVQISPAKLGSSEPLVSPFVAFGVGAFIPAGDSDYDKTQAAFTVKGGLEFLPIEYFVPYGSLRYTYCKDGDIDAKLGGIIVTVGALLRLPLM